MAFDFTGDTHAQPVALDRIDLERRREALSLATSGEVFDLSLELGEHIPQGSHGAFVPFSLNWATTPQGCARDGHAHQFAAETIIGALHIGTHIDGLSHIAADGRIFGGHAVDDVMTDRGFVEHGMETVRPIIGRGVILDVAGSLGMSALPDGYEITVDDVQQTLDSCGVRIQVGDVVCIRTGKVREYYTDPVSYQESQPGVGTEAAIWLYDQGMAVLGTDTTGTEPIPFLDEQHTTHRAMLVDRGVHLIENLFLDDVVAHDVYTGLFLCLPLRIKGATGSWVRPVLVR